MAGNIQSVLSAFPARGTTVFVVCISSVVLILLSLSIVIIRWPEWQRMATVRRASHVAIYLRVPENAYFQLDGASAQEVGGYIFKRSAPFHETNATVYPIYVYFIDDQNNCIYSCRLSPHRGMAADELRRMAKRGVEITEDELDDMITNTNYEKGTRRFR